jgi:1-aminocyclopropane-1-carboxylate synthase
MLSARGQAKCDQLDEPWRFAMRATYDAHTNPEGLISFATAENALMKDELEKFANNVCEALSSDPFYISWKSCQISE